MIKHLDFIFFNGNPTPGEFTNGAGIYSMNINVGHSKQPTEITLSIVREDGNYQLTEDDLSSLPHHTITIGSPDPADAKIVFADLALVSFDINRSPESKLATVKFRDRSIIFDKIQVGLLWKHSNGTFPAVARSNDPLLEEPGWTFNNGMGVPLEADTG